MARRPQPSGPSQRQLRVGELVRHALSEILSRGDVNDAVLASRVITVPEVRMSPDLRVATAYVMPLGGKDTAPVLEALNRNRKFLRAEVAQRINLRYAPEIRFRPDETFEEASRIERLLHSDKVRADLAAKRDADDGEG